MRALNWEHSARSLTGKGFHGVSSGCLFLFPPLPCMVLHVCLLWPNLVEPPVCPTPALELQFWLKAQGVRGKQAC